MDGPLVQSPNKGYKHVMSVKSAYKHQTIFTAYSEKKYKYIFIYTYTE
jgi:hypothetical protein